MADWISALAAAVALWISIIALHRSSLSRFEPIVTTGLLFFRIFPIRSHDGATWFIPSATVTVSVANQGAKPGAVLACRIAVVFPNSGSLNPVDYWQAKFELDPESDATIEANRFTWFKQNVHGHFRPFVIVSGGVVTKRMVFETRWDAPVTPGDVILTLEMYAEGTGRWWPLETWKGQLDENIWVFLSSENGGINYTGEKSAVAVPTFQSPDFYGRYGPKVPLPRGQVELGHAYLDYENIDEPSNGHGV